MFGEYTLLYTSCLKSKSEHHHHQTNNKPIFEWDPQAVAEPIIPTTHEVSVSNPEDFRKTFDENVNIDFGKIQKSIRRRWLKVGLMIMSQGLQETSAIEMSVACPAALAKPKP